jgi:hypothetical protein
MSNESQVSKIHVLIHVRGVSIPLLPERIYPGTHLKNLEKKDKSAPSRIGVAAVYNVLIRNRLARYVRRVF